MIITIDIAVKIEHKTAQHDPFIALKDINLSRIQASQPFLLYPDPITRRAIHNGKSLTAFPLQHTMFREPQGLTSVGQFHSLFGVPIEPNPCLPDEKRSELRVAFSRPLYIMLL